MNKNNTIQDDILTRTTQFKTTFLQEQHNSRQHFNKNNTIQDNILTRTTQFKTIF